MAQTYDSHELRASVVVDGKESKGRFGVLEAQKGEIETEMGEPLTWHNPPDTQMKRIYVRRTAILTDRTKWPEYQGWLLEKLEALHRIFRQGLRGSKKVKT